MLPKIRGRALQCIVVSVCTQAFLGYPFGVPLHSRDGVFRLNLPLQTWSQRQFWAVTLAVGVTMDVKIAVHLQVTAWLC